MEEKSIERKSFMKKVNPEDDVKIDWILWQPCLEWEEEGTTRAKKALIEADLLTEEDEPQPPLTEISRDLLLYGVKAGFRLALDYVDIPIDAYETINIKALKERVKEELGDAEAGIEGPNFKLHFNGSYPLVEQVDVFVKDSDPDDEEEKYRVRTTLNRFLLKKEDNIYATEEDTPLL